MYFVVLPHQLFEVKYLDKNKEYVLWEHPHYFQSYTFNKKKLVLHRASMQYYREYFEKQGYKVSKYVEFHQKFNLNGKAEMFDPIDKIKTPNNINFIESPNFLLGKEKYSEYRKKTKNFFFNAFYMWGKKKLDIIPNVKSQDQQNRKSIPKNFKPSKLPSSQAKHIN